MIGQNRSLDMGWLARLLFPLRFAWTDLCGWRSLLITLVNWLTMFLMALIAVAIYGLIHGTDQRQRSAFDENPLAGCQIYRTKVEGGTISEEQKNRLEAELEEKLSPGGLSTTSLFSLVRRDFLDSTGTSMEAVTGRTFAPGDPLFASFRDENAWLAGGPPKAEEEAIVVDREMLRSLGHDPIKPPSDLQINTPRGVMKVAVAGVLKRDLPGRFSFLMPEAVRDKLLERNRVARAQRYQTGKLPAAWASKTKPPTEALAPLMQKRLRFAGQDEIDDGEAWVLESFDDGGWPLVKDWPKHAVALVEATEKKYGPLNEKDKAFVLAGVVQNEKMEGKVAKEGHQRLAVYLRELDDLDTTATIAQEHGLQLQDDRSEQLRLVRQGTKRALAPLPWVLGGLAMLMLFNMIIIQLLLARSKRAEMGMLKAMGLTWWGLVQIWFWEAVLMWLPALLGGAATYWFLGPWAEVWLQGVVPSANLSFAIPMREFVWIIAAGLGMTLVSNALAVLPLVWMSPMKCLR